MRRLAPGRPTLGTWRDQSPGLKEVVVEIWHPFQVLPGESSQAEELLVLLEPLAVAEEGTADQTPCRLATGIIQEPLQGLKVQGVNLAAEADQVLPVASGLGGRPCRAAGCA